jgi:multidrug efflux pump subunit AcrB
MNTAISSSESAKIRPGPIAWMVRNPIAANLLMVILIAGGIWTAFAIQKEVFPEFELDMVEVYVSYPGADPAEVKQGILLPVEEAIRGVEGIEVPFTDIAKLNAGTAYTSINRRDGRRVVTVSMTVEPKSAITRVMNEIRGDVLPGLRADYPGVTWMFEGGEAEMRESTAALQGGFMMAMAVIYGLLAVIFASYIQPLIVMTAIPFGIVGAVAGHILPGFDLSLISLMGIIALSGVVVNDSLIMIHYANKKRAMHSAFDAIHQTGLRRFRPIVPTTLTTFRGLTPIILETSRQAAYLIPMAIFLGFGIVFATSIILVIVPCLYLVVEDIAGPGE